MVGSYLDNNPDVREALGGSCRSVVQHYVGSGIFQGRLTVPASSASAPNYTVLPRAPVPRDGNYYLSIQDFGSGANSNLNTNLDTSIITGLPNAFRVGSFLKGPSNQNLVDGQYGFTGVQQYGGQFAISIDSRTARNSHIATAGNAGGSLFTVTVGQNPPAPFWTPWPSGALRTSLELKIPYAGGSGGGVSQLVAYYFLRYFDSSVQNFKGFYIGVKFFDTRPSTLAPDIELNCNSTCISLTLRKSNPYMSASSYSGEAPSNIYKYIKLYEYEINNSNITNILKFAKNSGNPSFANIHLNPASYQVTEWNLNPEVFAPPGTDGWIGLSGQIYYTGAR